MGIAAACGTSHVFPPRPRPSRRPFGPTQDEGLAIRCSQTVRLSFATVTFTVFTEKSTQNLALANAFGP
jgi:hypothetical protein